MIISVVPRPVLQMPKLKGGTRRRRWHWFGGLAFLAVQLASWPVVSLICLGHRTLHDLNNEQAPFEQAVAILALFALLGLLGSSLLACCYIALPESWLSGDSSTLRLAVLTLGLSAFVTALCVPAMYAAYAGTTWQSPFFVRSVPYWCSLHFFVCFTTWSAVFHGVRYQIRFHRSRQQLLQSQALAREAQLEALRLQLNPHFFFNALNSVIGLVELDPPQAQEMLRQVAALMRRTLDRASFDIVRLDEEVELVRRYLRCEEFRFRERLQVHIDVPEPLARTPVPGMLLQPLIENAIQHGMKRGCVLQIEIIARAHTGKVWLAVRNNGALRAHAEDDRRDRTGLRLVRQRLRVQFPDTGEFELREDSGWVVAQLCYAPEEVLNVVEGDARLQSHREAARRDRPETMPSSAIG